MEQNHILFAFLLTLMAGLSTGIGGLIVLFAKRLNPNFLSGSLGFSAGVMIYVSFVELFPIANQSLSSTYGKTEGAVYTTLAFFAGMALIGLIDKLVPSFENPHEMKDLNEYQKPNHPKLMRVGVMTALVIAIHNFPEGLATLISGLNKPTLAISIAIAIAIHNIPEGIAVAVPIHYATKSKGKAFWFALSSGLAEPLGAIIGYFALKQLLGPSLFGLIFAAIAGIMVFISFDELLPTAEKYGKHHLAIYGLVAGMAVMAVSLLIF